MSYHYKDFNLMCDKNLFTAAKMGDVQVLNLFIKKN